MTIAAFDLVEIGDWVNEALDIEETEPLSENLNRLGFESLYFINNGISVTFFTTQTLQALEFRQFRFTCKSVPKLQSRIFKSQNSNHLYC